MKTYSEYYKDHDFLSNTYKNIRSSKDYHFKDCISQLMNSKFSNMKRNVDYLSIGCGDGLRTEKILNNLEIDYRFYYLDIINYQYYLFKKKTNLNPSKVYITPFENFNPNKKFDILESIHSWYGFAKSEKMLKKLINMIAKDGAAYILLGSKKNSLSYVIINELKNLNIKYLPILFFEDLLSLIKETNLEKNYKLQTIMETMSYPELIDNGKMTDYGKTLLDFYAVGHFPFGEEHILKEFKKILGRYSNYYTFGVLEICKT